MNRIFISYRSSDGKKDADRLCADLSRLIGDEQVFFDKQDLQGGSSWRDAITATLGTRPVVLLLITPDLLGMAHPEGGRRIDRDDDPIRNELLTAQHSGAIVVPLLTEGMLMPSASSVPEPLRFINEAHALKLRTDDWANDVERILGDLRTHGIQLKGTPADTPQPTPVPALLQRVQRWLMFIGGGFVALIALGFFLADDEPAKPSAAASAFTQTNAPSFSRPPAAGALPDISGIWWSLDADNRRLRVLFTVSAEGIELQTDAFPVGWYPHWVAYAQSVRDMGLVVTEVRYVGRGVLSHVMGVPHIETPFQAFTADGRGPLDTGSITLTASADGRELTGQIWSNGDQANTPLRLVRRP